MNRRFHCIIDAKNCHPVLLGDKNFIEGIVKMIAQKVDMKILKGPVIADGIVDNPGISCFAIIDFSHISIHTFTLDNEFCLDIFSCKPFNYKMLYDYIRDCFNLEDKDIKSGIVNYGRLGKIK